jgi:hypothetical protein
MATIKEMNDQLQLLDSWTQLSVYSSWSFMVNAACINAAMRYIPDAPVDNGIQEFTAYEAARRAMIKDAGKSNLVSLIMLQRDIVGYVENADGQARGLEDTLEFMTGTAPKAETFKREYEDRRRQGMKPAMPLKVFVDYEMERALNQYNQIVSKGDDAIRLIDTFTCAGMTASVERTPPRLQFERAMTNWQRAEDDGTNTEPMPRLENFHSNTTEYDDESEHKNELPDWITESFERKLIDKLHSRWEKLEFTRSNPRRRKTERDAAKADQIMIARVLAEYGEEPGFADMDDDEEQEGSATPLNEPTTASKVDVKAPGPVTVYRPSGTPAQINHRT